jgi:hypothetical protein
MYTLDIHVSIFISLLIQTERLSARPCILKEGILRTGLVFTVVVVRITFFSYYGKANSSCYCIGKYRDRDRFLAMFAFLGPAGSVVFRVLF